MSFYVYILASDTGTLYIGMTNDLSRRTWEHQQHLVKGFSNKYQCHKLIYFETAETAIAAIEREKQLKKLEPKEEGMVDTPTKPLVERPIERTLIRKRFLGSVGLRSE
jgi:putative endonuclease